MYLPVHIHSDVCDALTLFTKLTPTANSAHFALSIAGVLGLIGGDEATFSIATVLVHEGRRWLGWYNTPGSYWIARNYGLAAMSTLFKELFPGASTHPANVFEPDDLQHPRFRAVHSGTIQDSTGHLASLLMKECASLANESGGVGVSIVTLELRSPPEQVDLRFFSVHSIFAVVPVICSAAACIGCGFREDWYSFTSILLGMVSNGIFCLVIGRGTVHFTHHAPAGGSPPGNGLLGSGNNFILLRGDERAVNSITGGKLSLKHPGNANGRYIGYCAILFFIQFIAQLFIIPQASLVGQLTFVATLAVSWVWNLWFYVWEKEKIQSHILHEKVFQGKITLKREHCHRRTNAVVFALCELFLDPQAPRGNDGSGTSTGADDDSRRHVVASQILEALLPNDTRVWRTWKDTILERLFTKRSELHFERSDVDGPGLEGYEDEERDLLQTLYNYAQEAYEHYQNSLNITG